ncbi:hypothetical protein H2200_009220 [Cladophialophora chaetospira]|uniref:Uncharacterized protein n=1 Tax=Cladophialophora chaetospira TaxID=386627 RepID=A0AA38X3N9_9EURO|nr:hypothetical protein H2200_009220 [Cladophialophora chaetospira]
MSTSLSPLNGRAASDEVNDRDRPGSNLLSLPAFHSIREPSTERDGRHSRTESTASGSGSLRSERHAPEPDHNRLLDRLSFGGSSAKSDRSKEKEKENDIPRHNVSRNSGGFLLESISSSKRLSRGPFTPSQKMSEKRRNGGESELMVAKRRHKSNGHANSSFRSSPLTSEVKQDPIIHNSPSPDHHVTGTDARRSHSSIHNESRLTDSSASTSRNMETQNAMAKVGYDHDPAQIVNMALSLSEGRRRLASGRRYVSTEQGERRIISTASTMTPSNTVRRRSIAPFMSAKRQTSQHGSPGRKASTPYRDSVVPSPKLPPNLSVDGPEDELEVDSDFADHVSPATAARVEKAKIYFELAHEHRRLLSHLPPLRRPSVPPRPGGPEMLQKAYNPLQYVRNRKLRIWEKTPINSEVEGWHDVQKVRAWVEAVVSSHSETQHDPLECVRLPPLDLRTVDTDGEDADDPEEEPKTAVSPRVPDHLHPKPSRPRSDWVTHPADLIADAFWLEQGLNKTKIQDRDNNLIYPPNTHFKFSGWRNRTPVHDIPRALQQPSPPDSPVDLFQEPPPSALPELPTFTSAHTKNKSGRHGRRRDLIRDSLQPKEGSSSRERSRIRKKLFQDSSDSDPSASSSDQGRGRKRLRRKRLDAANVGNAEKREGRSHSKQPSLLFGHGHDSSQGSSAPTSKRGSIDHSALNKLFKVDTFKKASPMTQSRNRQDGSRPRSTMQVRSSIEQERPPRPSTDYDTTTAPNSPTNVEWPSIAINLSPPPSRSTSPTRKPISTILHPFQRKSHKEQGSISATDFAHFPPVQASHEVAEHSDAPDSRGQSPMTRGVSPLSRNRTQSTEPDEIALHSSNEQRHSVASKVSTRSAGATGADHSRLRGIFKGGRIAELVGNEVSRVGDFIWKRDPPIPDKHRGSMSDASIRSYGSDSDKDHHHHHPQNGTILKTPPPLPRSRSSTLESTPSDHVSPSTAKLGVPGQDRPRYHNPNLPSFTSPFQRDRDQQEKTQGLLVPDDATARGESTDSPSRLRSNSRSPRLAQLPRLDTGAPNTPNDLSRQNTYGFGAALDLSRSREATDQLNAVLGPVTGLTRLRPDRSTGDLMGGSEAGLEREPGDVTWRDIERAYVLLFTSTVKAREIGRRADDSGEEIPEYLLKSLTTENKALHTANPLRVKRRERHIVAAKNIMKTLDGHSLTFNHKLHSFTSSLVPTLHTQLQALEDQVENTMTPQVRVTADNAGELSMKISSTSTLAVKELNDTIEVAFRRKRRGPIRFFRKAWFAGMEWTVVGLLWLIWAVVSIIQGVTGTFRCMVRVTRWLLWVD